MARSMQVEKQLGKQCVVLREHDVFANGGNCTERVLMEDRIPTTFGSDRIYRRTVGRPRKYACSWFAKEFTSLKKR